MRLFADSSALVKVYLAERDSETAGRAVAGARQVAASRIAQTEVTGRLLRYDAAHDHIKRFTALWSEVAVVEVDEPLCLHAAQLTADRGLRTLDALHLASALAVADDDLVVATWDRRLWDAARAEGLAVLPDERP
jgi:predicted nucleic acid-binding protein